MISLCITTYHRDSLLFESFRHVLSDERITEIVIVDDCSNNRFFENVKAKCDTMPKVKLFRNEKNLGCYRNKKEAISKASNEWVIILDSDNVIRKDFIDVLYEDNVVYGWKRDTILSPEFARPHFNYHQFSGATIDRETIKQYIPNASKTRFDCLINCMNYFVNRDEYLKVWDGSIEPWTADTIFQNYNWLKAGNKIYVKPGLQYDHLVHDGSHYKEHVTKTEKAHNGGNLYKEIERKMMML